MFEVLDKFCSAPFWDHNLTWNTTAPDLTPCMQATLLAWIPCAFLWAFAPLELYFQKTSVDKALPWTAANISKMLVALALVLLCFTNILDALLYERLEKMFTANITAWSLKMLTFVLSIVLMFINKKRGRHTSGVLFLFWLCLTICEVFTYTSTFLQLQKRIRLPGEITFVAEMIYFPLLVCELMLSCLADIRRRHRPHRGNNDGLKECPEQRASFTSRLLFWWFNDLCILGWKKPLIVEDLWQLSPEKKTEYVSAQFEKHFSHASQPIRSDKEASGSFEHSNGSKFRESTFITDGQARGQRGKKDNVTSMLIKTFWAPFVCGGLCRFFHDSALFLNPVILKLIIDFVNSSDPIWKGVLFAALLFVKGLFQAVLVSFYYNNMYTLGMRIRTALISAIYKKSLVLSPGAKRESTVGEIVNLMSVDSQRFFDLMVHLNMLWAAPLQIVVAVALLWQELGPSVLAGLFSMIVLIPLNAFLASQAKKLQVKQMKNKDERVKLINEVLSGIKVLKLYAWEESFREKIEAIRNKEIRQLRKMAYFSSVGVVIWSCSPFLVTLATFATYVLVDEKHVLDATKAFVSLSLFNILKFPLSILPDLITTMIMVSVSVKRINKYLNSEELEQYVLQDSSQVHPVVVQNGDFAWSRSASDEAAEEERPLSLRSIHLSVQKGALVAVVGQVGSGKSSLLSAILGDMQKLGGTVSLNGTTAYVSQQPWIQNTSLQNNILFSGALKKDVYDEVVEACGLAPDLAILPGGDATEIGEKGINLSGGQKQRVSLARAVYSSADIYLLDDPLSAVDSHVGKHIFEKVIGPSGLLKQKTRILVTHSLTYLPQTDVIYVMKDGMIAERGSFQELVDSKGPFAEFLAQYFSTAEGTEEDLEILEDISHKNPDLLRSLSVCSDALERSGSDVERSRKFSVLSAHRRSRRRTSSVATGSHATSSGSIERLSASQKDSNTKLIKKETAETGQVKWSVYRSYLRAVNFVWVLVILSAYVMWQTFSVGANVWLSAWATDKPGPNNTQIIPLRNRRLGIYGALGLGQCLCMLIGSFSIAHGTLSASNSLHRSLLSNVLRSPMSFFDTIPLGRILNRFANDVDTVDTTIPMTLRSWLSYLLQVTSTIVVISIQTPIFMAVVLPVGVLYCVIQRFFVATTRQLRRLESITRSPIYSNFSETLAGSSTIRAYRAEHRFCLQSNEMVDKNQICCYPAIVSSRWLAIRLDFCGNCVIFFAALFAVLQRDHLDAGRIGLSVSYSLMITAALNWLVNLNCVLETNIVAVERVIEYTTTETEAEWIVESKRPPEDWPSKGEVRMENYSTRYRKGLELVLKGISCHIKSGEKVGIVGRTGAGKSSLTLSLFRIIEAAGGSISIDGLNIADLGLHDLRSKITIIPQDPVLFSGSLRMNLDPFSSYSDEKVWQVLDHAHLKGFVSSLNSGLMHDIVEGGENLSVGQRQLVCLARALLRKTRILVLDEATAAVDLETDDLIQATIRREFDSATVLTIAHRLNTVMDYDRIMVLDNGRVVEFDSPDVLKQDKKSIFYGMAKDAGLV